MAKRKKKKLSRRKVRKILRHGSVRGHKLTKKQRGFFGAKLKRRKRKKR